ncbi:terminase family protein [Shewanella sp. D64]|uniref:terminase large subunit domain-containing protein n=1 Tax=unclassified Shewanella TaxID=196818 RepID=UPI0022BA3303|nr:MULTISPECIES: terminase family protein [unclassified Shewanella]MEC4728836.1 terminase family protein [Shewanella sp. D64]MEC4740710.1 terminase family protein [Shewanella sp. E94]WBJ95331.1 terminase family protein [Shewanella sp. MTB7]
MKENRKSRYSEDIKQQAKDLYLACLTPKEIAEHLSINSVRTVYNWINSECWNTLLSAFSVQKQLEQRITQLTNRDLKKKTELDEIDRLVANLIKLQAANAKLREHDVSLREREAAIANGGYGAAAGETGNKKKKKKRKNDIPDIDDPRWQDWISCLYSYQLVHFQARHLKERWTIKSRQIGFTFEAAGEALHVAVETGRNQTFLSASKAQAYVFRSYITNLAEKYFGIELKGDPIRLPNGAELRFIGTNRNTAQSYSSDLYIDEACWIGKFEGIYETAGAMSTLKDRRITVFSTPSTRQHGAYRVWSGAYWKKGDATRADIPFPSKDTLRKHPQVCPDKRWRYVVTAQDAVDGGNPNIDIEDLRERCSKDAFQYLYCGEFIDEADSLFALSALTKCIRDNGWSDVDLSSTRPYGDNPVAIGYDPARTGDLARCYVLSIPQTKAEAFRVLESFEYRGFHWSYQAEQIKKLTERYNVQHIGVDCSGIGSGVAEMVQAFFPRVMKIAYTQQSKQTLVLKVMDLISTSRLKWPATFETIAPSFMAIKRKQTGHGTMTFAADRTEETGHADDFFAIAHAVACEGLNASMQRQSTIRVNL